MHVVNWKKIERVVENSICFIPSTQNQYVLLKTSITELKKIFWTNSAKYPNAPYVQVDHWKKIVKKILVYITFHADCWFHNGLKCFLKQNWYFSGQEIIIAHSYSSRDRNTRSSVFINFWTGGGTFIQGATFVILPTAPETTFILGGTSILDSKVLSKKYIHRK